MTGTWFHLLWGFFIANALGYGGGPASIPMIQEQVVHHYQWLSSTAFANVLALANALPGPIATKLAAAVGYQAAGWIGVIVALSATAVPSALVLIGLLHLMNRFRESAVVHGMTLLVQPAIAVLMGILTWEVTRDSIHAAGRWQSLGIAAVSLLAMTKGKVHPALVVVGAFVYGGLVMSHLTAV